MKTYSEREKGCEDAFQSGGPYWHAYTSGKDTPLLFVNDSDFKFAMNAVAQAASMYPIITILAFEIMGNHFHFVIAAEQDDIDIFGDISAKAKQEIPEPEIDIFIYQTNRQFKFTSKQYCLYE